MVDSRLRDLERRWKAVGLGEAAYLQERLRAGDLTLEGLSVAADLGYPASSEVLKIMKLPVPGPCGLKKLFVRAQRWGHSAAVRLGCAVSRIVLPVSEHAHPHDPCPRAAIDASERWLLAPNEAAARAAHDARRAVLDTIQGRGQDLTCSYACCWWSDAAAGAVAAVTAGMAAGLDATPQDLWNYTQWFLAKEAELEPQFNAVFPGGVGEAEREILAGVRDELVTWALGYCDPVSDRLASK